MQSGHEIEYELTFLARALPPEISGLKPKRLVDIYIPEDMSVHPHLRLRQKGGSFEITKKQPVADKDSSTQIEITIPLEKEEFDTLATGSQRSVTKDRYKVNLAGRPAEVDVFRDKLEGLVLIDFEFASEKDKAAFKAPDICLADVTQEPFTAGGLLAGQSYTNIAAQLEKYGYTPISS